MAEFKLLFFKDGFPYSANSVSSTPPIQNSVSYLSQEVSDKFWSQSTELLDKVRSNSSITITRVSTGSPIETSESQSPELFEAPEEETLNIETAPNQAMPPIVSNPTPKMISEPIGPLDFSKGGGELAIELC